MERPANSKPKEVTIMWSNPLTVDEVIALPREDTHHTSFYKYVLHYNGSYKLYYIGKTDRYVRDRLLDKDHKKRQEQHL